MSTLARLAFPPFPRFCAPTTNSVALAVGLYSLIAGRARNFEAMRHPQWCPMDNLQTCGRKKSKKRNTKPRAEGKNSDILVGSPGRAHIEHPAAVVNSVDPCHIPNACDVLAALEGELYPSGPNADTASQFFVQFTRWGPGSVPKDELMMFATAVFPREGIQRLAEICRDNDLILIRGVLTLINPKTKARASFNYAAAVADLIDSVPEVQDVYTFGVRKSKNDPLIICGAHAHL